MADGAQQAASMDVHASALAMLAESSVARCAPPRMCLAYCFCYEADLPIN